jgi:hypothetical protein
MAFCYSHRPGAVALSLTEKKDKILSAHDQIDTGNLLSNV